MTAAPSALPPLILGPAMQAGMEEAAPGPAVAAGTQATGVTGPLLLQAASRLQGADTAHRGACHPARSGMEGRGTRDDSPACPRTGAPEASAGAARDGAWPASLAAGRGGAAPARRTLRDVGLGGFDPADGLVRALVPLLEALGWDGAPRDLAEALPHATDRLDLVALCDVMASLGFTSTVLRDSRADCIDPRLMPALLVPADGRALVLLEPASSDPGRSRGQPTEPEIPTEGPACIAEADARGRSAPARSRATFRRNMVLVLDPALDAPVVRWGRRLRGDICLFQRTDQPREAGRGDRGARWVAALLSRFRGLLAQVTLLTFLIYLMAVAPALFIMAVYDRVIPAQSVPTLVSLLIGVGIALLGEALLRTLRGRILARFGGRLGLLMADGLFAHLLALPAAISERMRMGARVQRLRQYEGLRDALAGQAAITLVELPFAAVFLVVLALLAGPLALVPLAAVGVYALAALALAPALLRVNTAAAHSAMARQDFLFEAITHAEELRLSGAVPRWRARFRALSGTAAHAGYRAQTLAALVTSVGQAVMVVAGLLTIGLGAMAMMDGLLSMGALIAVMTLTWRALAPIQAGFVLLTRLSQLRATAAGIDQAMAMPREASASDRRKDTDPVPIGGIRLSRVSFKYAPDLDPAMMAISADIAPGEIVAVTGPNGAGKSTLLKLLLGLYPPQAGTILIDGIDIRQHPPVALRQAIGHVAQEFELFFGTIGQNLRLSMPTASDADIAAAIEQAGITPLIDRLPGGLGHRVGDGRNRHVPASLVGGLGLAAAYLRQPRLLLLDEVIDNLDPARTAAFHRQIDRCRGHVTMVMVTHRPATMQRADRVLVLNAGSIVKNAPPGDLF